MIRLNQITLRRGTRVLLQNANWTIYHKQRIGLIGSNGSGKSTLFSLLLNTFELDAGEIDIAKHIRMAHVKQETISSSQSALDFTLDGDQTLRRIEHALREAEANEDAIQIAHCHDELSIIDGYTANTRAAIILAGLGFTESAQQQPVSSFSGGWRIRLNLAQALLCPSDLLLLDEPTNHLDLDAVLWLTGWLKQYQGTIILISHDRDFLDETVDHIAHLNHQRLDLYTGNYTAFETMRAAKLMQQQAAFEKQQKSIQHLQSYIDRFRYKASKAKQAQSRIKALDRMELICAIQTESPFQFEFSKPNQCPNPLITLDNVNVGYDSHTVLRSIQLSITPQDRITLLGANGAGKSTFVKLLAGALSPQKGECTKSAGLAVGYFAQHQVDALTLSHSALDHLSELKTAHTELQLRQFLGGFGFSGDTIFAPVSQFSGGEKSRLALALIVFQKPNLLLLDEPTNHLDLEMRQALSLALQSYEGALILITHDTFLMRNTADQLWLVANQSVQPFEGDIQDYEKWLRQPKSNVIHSSEKIPSDSKSKRQESAAIRNQLKPITQKIQQLEKELTRLESELNQVEHMLSDETIYRAEHKEKRQEALTKQMTIKKQIEEIELDWLAACEKRDEFLS